MLALYLDHITVIAPSLAEGVLHVRACLDLDVPFGQRHDYMGSHNHLLQLGDSVYLEIVDLDVAALGPGRPRWFGLDDAALPLDGAVPSIIDRRGKPRAMAAIADLGARLRCFTLEYPDPAAIAALYDELAIDCLPAIVQGPALRFRAKIEVPAGLREPS